jgi:hypothetical protein
VRTNGWQWIWTVAGLLLVLGVPSPSQAQSFLPRAGYYFQWSALLAPDPRFGSDGAMGVDVDLVDYGRGRLTFVVDYEAVLGREARPFEINHDNFAMEASSSARVRATEVAVAFHHASRHLSDRPNSNIIAWNVLDFRAARQYRVGASTIDARLAAGQVLQSTFVDYTWTADLHLSARRPVTGRVGVFASGAGRLVGVDRSKVGRDRQCGARLETGLRVKGGAAALELFVGYERRIDGFPTERTRMRMFAFGFRLVG